MLQNKKIVGWYDFFSDKAAVLKQGQEFMHIRIPIKKGDKYKIEVMAKANVQQKTVANLLQRLVASIVNFFSIQPASPPVLVLDPNYEVVKDPVALSPQVSVDVLGMFSPIMGSFTPFQTVANPQAIDAFLQVISSNSESKNNDIRLVTVENSKLWQRLALPETTAKEDGFIEVSVRNEEANTVFFDNLFISVARKEGVAILQENHYEAFRMSLQGLDYVLTKTEI